MNPAILAKSLQKGRPGQRNVLTSIRREGPFALLLGAMLPLVIPYVAIVAVGGGIVRMAFPVYVLGLAMFVLSRRPAAYPAFIVAIFAFDPFLRRVADYQAGFVLLNPILLAPYIGMLPAFYWLAQLLRRGGRTWPFAAFVLCVAYASVLALFQMRVVPAFYEAITWLAPVAMAAYVLENRHLVDRMHAHLIGVLAIILPILGVYGVVQYVNPPLWDIFWMNNIANPTFGRPEAYQIRVFSMMNAPGPTGVFIAFAFVVLAAAGPAGLLPGIIALPTLALTLVRTAWLGSVVGIVTVFCVGGGRQRVSILCCALALLGCVAAEGVLPVEARNILESRFNTLSQMSTDTSADERLGNYEAFFGRLSESPLGEGFGANQGTSTSGEHRNLVAIDSGLMEPYLIFGIPLGTVYFVALGALGIQAYRGLGRDPSGKLAAGFAVVCMVAAMLPLGTVQAGEGGSLEWPVLAFLLAGDYPFRANKFVMRTGST